MKKKYIKPTVKTVNMLPVIPIAISAEANAFTDRSGNRVQLSRESDDFSWDDEEEESMWK